MRNNLTARQQREREYYDKYSLMHELPNVNFEPIRGKEKRLWNSYWAVYSIVTDFYKGPDQELLDLGCGTGRASMLYARIGYQVSGCDIAEGNIQRCRELSLKYNCETHTRFSVGAAEQLDYEDESFDIVVGIDVLHHVNIASVLQEVLRMLKRGGSAIFRDPVEIPVFDVLRRTRLVTHFFPMGMSFEEHRTADEKKLNKKDLHTIHTIFPICEERRFVILSRIRGLLNIHHPERASRLEMIDYWLMRCLPLLKHFGRDVIHILRK